MNLLEPLQLPRRAGLPYHGLVTRNDADGCLLELPNGDKKTHIRPFSGHCWLLKSNNFETAPQTTSEEQAAGMEWRNYGILSGLGRIIGNHQLGSDHWLYCDEHRAWEVRATMTVNRTARTLLVRLYLVKPFGLIYMNGQPPPSMAERELASGYCVIPDHWYTDTDFGELLWNFAYDTQPSPDGANCIVNIFGDIAWGDPYNAHNIAYGTMLLSISGNGSIASGSVGSGITGSVIQYRTQSELYWTLIGEDETRFSHMFWIDANGAVQEAYTTYSSTHYPAAVPTSIHIGPYSDDSGDLYYYLSYRMSMVVSPGGPPYPHTMFDIYGHQYSGSYPWIGSLYPEYGSPGALSISFEPVTGEFASIDSSNGIDVVCWV